MLKIFITLLCLITVTTIDAQIHEVGVFLGGSNFVGDIGETTYIKPNEPAFGFLYKWNKSPRHSYRFSYTQSQISGNDKDSKEQGRQNRGYSFVNNLKELSAGLEFNFFDFNLHDYKNKITPYVYSGLNFIYFDGKYLNSNTIKSNGSSTSIAIPMALGLKSNISENFILAVEVRANYTFTDNIDGSNSSNESLPKFGNINNNDWYVFSGVTLTYTFGEKPCYCSE
jgi:outer membrane protein W